MKVNSPREKTVSIDKVKEAMRLASMEFMEVDDYMVIKRNGNLVSFNPMTSDDDAILLAKMAGLSIRSGSFCGKRVIGFYFSYDLNQKHSFICDDTIKRCSVKGRFVIRKNIVEFINKFGVNQFESDEEGDHLRSSLEFFIGLPRG